MGRFLLGTGWGRVNISHDVIQFTRGTVKDQVGATRPQSPYHYLLRD